MAKALHLPRAFTVSMAKTLPLLSMVSMQGALPKGFRTVAASHPAVVVTLAIQKKHNSTDVMHAVATLLSFCLYVEDT